jgi:hypothetical protein
MDERTMWWHNVVWFYAPSSSTERATRSLTGWMKELGTSVHNTPNVAHRRITAGDVPKKKTHHFPRGIGAKRICIAAINATAKPCVATTFDQPMLGHYSLPGIPRNHPLVARVKASRPQSRKLSLQDLYLQRQVQWRQRAKWSWQSSPFGQAMVGADFADFAAALQPTTDNRGRSRSSAVHRRCHTATAERDDTCSRTRLATPT